MEDKLAENLMTFVYVEMRCAADLWAGSKVCKQEDEWNATVAFHFIWYGKRRRREEIG